jgi:anaerobic selenocysteine-containing dehydrogenase/Fe-S-cluster-containing dehydrogenase component
MTEKRKQYGMLINLNRCIGCYACQVTCKAEYEIPFGTFRCRVETYQSGRYPEIKKFFLPRLCNHCDNAPCIEACEEDALFKNTDGVVMISNSKCTGCQICYEKCPYKAIEINPYTGIVEKCDFCYSRVINGLLPVCVQSCIGKAMIFGDINDKKSEISIALKKNLTAVRQVQIKALSPELRTNPLVFYVFKDDTLGSPLRDSQIIKGVPSTQRVSVEYAQSPHPHFSKLIHTSDVMCPSECGISVLVENGIAKKIYGNPHSLINNGAFCAKGASALQLTYSPHRIKTPLMRTGQRGEDKWKSITWDEASDYIAKKLIEIKQKHGPESVFLDTGDVTDREAYFRLFHAFGTPNTYHHGSICDSNRRWGQGIMLGDERPLPDIQRPVLMRNDKGEAYLKNKHDAKLILHIGVNPFVATRFNYMSYGIPAAREENGCIYIVVDPAHTSSAAHADIWLPIRPGTDAALLAAMLYYIIKNASSENRYIDQDFLEKYTTGWEEFKDTFLSYAGRIDSSNNLYFFTPEWAEEKTSISKDDIEKIAHLFGTTKPASIEIGMHGTAHHTNGDVTSILMVALCLITGNVDNPGGLVFIESQKVKKGDKTSGKEFLGKAVSRRINGKDVSGKLSELNKDLFGEYPAAWKGVLVDLPQKIRERIKLKYGSFREYSYPVKAFFTRAGNPVITAGNTSNWIDALTSKDEQGEYLLELMVFIDTHITVTGRYADIILPEAGFLERMGLSDVYTMSPEVAIREQVIKPLYESKTPFEIMISLSEALIKNGDPDIRTEDFKKRYKSEEDFINESLSEAPWFYNIGEPLPYPDIPEGSLIIGTPDNPTAIMDEVTNPPTPPFDKGGQRGFSVKKVIKQGERLTVDWLRRHNGVAVWPTGYYRYKKSDGSPSGVYPRTNSKKFEFKFSYLENINKKLGTNLPTTFYWTECRWNSKNSSYKDVSKEYPFQLISGRVHYAMTMTTVCPYLAETETECMKPMNDEFMYSMPEVGNIPRNYGIPVTSNKFQVPSFKFQVNTVSIPIFAFNTKDAERLGIKNGDIVILENPLKKSVKGKAFLTQEIMPGVIKTAFGPGGQKASGISFVNNTSEYTPNINELFDPENISSFTGMPGFGDIMVRVIKG